MTPDETESTLNTLQGMAKMKLIRTAEVRNQYRCQVCGEWDEWSDSHGAFERLVGTGYRAYEIDFITCSDKCRQPENLKEPFITWLSSHLGWGKVRATKNYNQTIKLYAKTET